MKAIDPGPAGEPPARSGASRRGSLWWWIVIAIALQFAAWMVWIIVATRHPIEEVPIATDSVQRAK